MHPTVRATRHHAQHERFRRHPSGQPSESRNLTQGLGALFQLEMAQVFLHDRGHGHAQSGRKILDGHGFLLLGIG